MRPMQKFIELNDIMQEDLDEFAALMIEKLHKNKHKDTVKTHDVPAMMELLLREVGEFVRQYMEDREDPNLERELADIANFAFLIYQTTVKRV
jgi:ubiquitin C-terminal hydrolase